MAKPIDKALKNRLIQAATQAFSDLGFAGASMVEIGRRAGVTKGGVYMHFRSKEELFFEVLDHWRGSLAQIMATRRGEKAGVLRQFLVDYLAFHFQYPEAASLLRVLATELRGRFTAQVREDLRGAQRLLRSRIRDLLARETQEGQMFAEDPAYAAFLLASAVEGVLSLWISAPRDAEPFCHPENLVNFLLVQYEVGASNPALQQQQQQQQGPGQQALGVDFLPPLRD